MLAAFHLNLTALSYSRAAGRAVSRLQHRLGGGAVATRGDRHAARARSRRAARCGRCFWLKRRRWRRPGAARRHCRRAGAGGRRGRADVDHRVGPLHRDGRGSAVARLASVALAFATGVPLALLAALVPALRGQPRVPPTAAMRGAERSTHARPLPARFALAGVVLLRVGGVARDARAGRRPASIRVRLGDRDGVRRCRFSFPAILSGVARALGRPVAPPARASRTGWRSTNLSAAVPRLSISVAALAVSLSMMVAMPVMIGSFRETVDLLGRPDAAGRPVHQSRRTAAARVRADALGRMSYRTITAEPGCRRGRSIPEHRSRLTARRVMRVAGGDFARTARARQRCCSRRPPMRARRCAAPSARTRSSSPRASSSSSTSTSATMSSCRRPTAPCRSGSRRSTTTTRATAASSMMDRSDLRPPLSATAPPARSASTCGPGPTDEAARERSAVRAIGEAHRVFINTNASLRTEVLRIFDSTFAITYALEIIAILVAMLGVCRHAADADSGARAGVHRRSG